MSRSITAALSKMAMEDRLPLFFRLRKSSLDTRFAAEVRSMYRVAARLVWASFDNAAYDMMYRLQVLEAVHTGEAEDLLKSGWWRRPRQGMKAARDAFEGTNIKEEWFSMGNTGMVSKIEAMIRRGYNNWSRQYALSMSWEDMMQRSINGLGQNENPLPSGPHAGQVGARNTAIRAGIPAGRETPRDTASQVGKFAVQKIGDELRKLYRQMGSNQTPEGNDVIEYAGGDIFSGNQDDRLGMFLALIKSEDRFAVHLRDILRQEWAGASENVQGMLDEWLSEITSGRRPRQTEIAKNWGVAGGTFQRNLKKYVGNAVLRIQKNPRLQDAISQWVTRNMAYGGRNASKRSLMSRQLTASILKMAMEDRLSLFFHLRSASADRRNPAQQRQAYRVASRVVAANIESAAYDMVMRLQVLEGVHTGSAKNLTWYRNPRRGMAAAKDAFEGMNVHPDWFSSKNTKLVGVVYGLVDKAYKSYSRATGGLRNTTEDIMQNAIAGLGISLDPEGLPKPMPGGPIAGQVGAKNSGVQRDVTGGKPPVSVAGNIGNLIARKVGDEAKSLQKLRKDVMAPGSGDDAKTRNRIDQATDSPFSQGRTKIDIFRDLLDDERSDVRKMVQTRVERDLGKGKWSDLAGYLLVRELKSDPLKKGENAAIARKFDMAPGTFSKVKRTKVQPVVESIRRDRGFLNKVRDLVDDAYELDQRTRRAYRRANWDLPTKIEVRYNQINERTNNWVLEVRNTPYKNTLTDTDWPKFLKGLGLWWDRSGKYWHLPSGGYRDVDTMLAMGGNPLNEYGEVSPEIIKKNKAHARRRQQQKKAWPVLREAVSEYNRAVQGVLDEASGRKRKTDGAKEWVQWAQRHSRMINRLKDFGIEIGTSYKDSYGYITGPRLTYVTGNTFPIKDLMKKYKFRWKGDISTGWNERLRGKAWALPLDHFVVVGDQWMGDIIRALSTEG